MNANYLAEGGIPITPKLAMELRQMAFGTSAAPTRCEWTQTSFIFGTPKEELAYGLKCPRNATRGLLTAVQGFILKYFLFDRRSRSTSYSPDGQLHPVESQQIESLVISLMEILINIAEKTPITVVLPGDESFVPHSVQYFHDSVTEKLFLFELKRDDLQFFLKRHIVNFTEESGPGALLFLYSCILTRTISKVRTDIDGAKGAYLVSNNEEGSLNIVTLLLTGRATPYFHNGVQTIGDESNYALPQYGILKRCPIGLLLWENDTREAISRQPGSRLKTPNYPIWVTCCSGHYGVIFNTNQDLLRNYHAESRFDLFYYSCSANQILMTIDNRAHHEQAVCMLERQSIESGNQSFSNSDKDETASCPLHRLIHTKWDECIIQFHVQPSVLSYLFSVNN